ncbi:MAG TPA: hypothetical protein VFN35_31165 [Ktedonobacteraceae bacterium]|nr:hypothetical protein [Ktedonobacteraceae bacterium]
MPSPVPPGAPPLDEAFEQTLVSNLDGVTVDHYVQPSEKLHQSRVAYKLVPWRSRLRSWLAMG